MATLGELRKSAKNMGIAASVIRSATSASELQKIIADHSDNGKATKKSATKAVKKAVAKKKSKTAAKPAKKAAKKSKTTISKTRASKSAPAKSTGRKAKRPTTAKSSNGYVPKGGRNLLDDVDYSETDGWNPREGSAPDLIVRSLRKFRGNRTKVFEALKGDVWNFVGKKFQDGSRRPLKDGPGNAHEMLKYRISRTAWDFAKQTGQHDVASNRVEYGTGGTGEGVFKAKRKASKTKAAPAKRGRPAGKKSAATGRKKVAAAKRRTAGKKKSAGRRR